MLFNYYKNKKYNVVKLDNKDETLCKQNSIIINTNI